MSTRLHFPEGFIHAGKKWRACCHCGHATTARVTRERASEALDTEHGWTNTPCAICGIECANSRPWTQFRPLVDGDQEVWVCRDDSACSDRYRADRDADTLKCGCEQVYVAAFGHYHDTGRPVLRVVE